MNLLLTLHKTKKYLAINIIAFIVFMIIYTLLDINGNDSYGAMSSSYGNFIVLVHILINTIISLVSSIVITWSYISLNINKKDVITTNIPFIGIILGFFTFGCTPCVVASLSIFGITFAPLVLPNGNLLWKFLVLILVVVSAVITGFTINKGCSIEKNNR
ncbi:hypothetical protein KHQ82_06200 [Mycoplasmatota bacterium]|nr:hypothetical protein KHQ82_06200 [Mycoplasmatota bacterium]